MTTISSETILRSRHAQRPELIVSTLLWTYPRWIHAEGRTHRLLRIAEDFEILIPSPSPMEDENLSRNAASSRAIPVKKMIEAIRLDPAVPLFWGKNVAGMQAKEELGPKEKAAAERIWMRSMESAIAYAEAMCELGIDEDDRVIGAHKQIVNRILEPYMHIKVLVTATEWSNFIGLRDHGDAEPHIAILARETRKCLEDESHVQTLEPGEWHLPWITAGDAWNVGVSHNALPEKEVEAACTRDLVKLSVGRSASTSYKTVDGFDMTLDRAIALHDKLVSAVPLHASPCEHQCQADTFVEGHLGPYGEWSISRWSLPHLHGNLRGFNQYRKMLPNEHI